MPVWTRGWKTGSLLRVLCVSPSRSVLLKTSPAPDSPGNLRSQIADDVSDLAQGQGVWKATVLIHSCRKQVFSHTDYTLIWTGKTNQGKACTSLSLWQVKLTSSLGGISRTCAGQDGETGTMPGMLLASGRSSESCLHLSCGRMAWQYYTDLGSGKTTDLGCETEGLRWVLMRVRQRLTWALVLKASFGQRSEMRLHLKSQSKTSWNECHGQANYCLCPIK